MVTEHVQWEDHLVFKVGGKSFAITSLEPKGHFVSLKCTREAFAELVERPGVVPAPYLARAHWIAVETAESVNPAELLQWLTAAYMTAVSSLPKKLRQTALAARESGR
jgi:predicted DNA-binding protein (MmcQ/YjbR family)